MFSRSSAHCSSTVLPSFALGVASGMRSMAGPALLSRQLRKTDGPHRGVAGFLARPLVAGFFQVALIGEFVGDKLPQTPNRIDAGPLVGRLTLGSLAGAALAQASEASPLAGALAGGFGAIAGAYVGFYARRVLTHQAHLPDPAVALGEDVLTVALAHRAARV